MTEQQLLSSKINEGVKAAIALALERGASWVSLSLSGAMAQLWFCLLTRFLRLNLKLPHEKSVTDA